MYVRVKDKPNGMRAVQLVASYRRGGGVGQKIIRHIGQGKTDSEIEELKKLGEFIRLQTLHEKQPVLPLYAPEDIYKKIKEPAAAEQDTVSMTHLRSRQFVVDGVSDVLGALYDELGWNRLIRGTRKDLTWNRILRSIVLARIANPSSKKGCQHLLAKDMGIKLRLDSIYRMMDHVNAQKDRIHP